MGIGLGAGLVRMKVDVTGSFGVGNPLRMESLSNRSAGICRRTDEAPHRHHEFMAAKLDATLEILKKSNFCATHLAVLEAENPPVGGLRGVLWANRQCAQLPAGWGRGTSRSGDLVTNCHT